MSARRRSARSCRVLLPAAVLSAAIGAAHSALPLELTDPRNGAAIRLESGAAALHLVFFATWCPPCLEELDELTQLEARWQEQGYRLVLIAVPTRHTVSRLARFIEDRTPPGQLLFDSDGRATKALGAESLPRHVLLDATGREVLRAEFLEPAIGQAVRELLRGTAVESERRP